MNTMFNREQLESFIRSLDQLIETATETKKAAERKGDSEWLVLEADRTLKRAIEDRQRYLDRLESLES